MLVEKSSTRLIAGRQGAFFLNSDYELLTIIFISCIVAILCGLREFWNDNADTRSGNQTNRCIVGIEHIFVHLRPFSRVRILDIL